MKKVLVIQNKFIGDVLYSTVYFEFIKQKYPEAEIHYVISKSAEAVIYNHPYIDKVIVFPGSEDQNTLKLIWLIFELRKTSYDAVIDVYSKLNSLFVSIFIKAKIKVAYRKWYSRLFYTKTFKRLKNSEYHSSLAIENRLKLLSLLDIPYKTNILPKIYLTDEEIHAAEADLVQSGIDVKRSIIMLCIFGSTPAKSYPKAYMVELIESITNAGDYQILMNYALSQKKDMEELYSMCSLKTQGLIAKNVYGKSLRQLMSFSYFCRAVIGNDGGPINIAKALDIPSFAIYSPELNKVNWYGQIEKDKHVAVHLSDYLPQERIDEKPTIESKYHLFKPAMFYAELFNFLKGLAS